MRSLAFLLPFLLPFAVAHSAAPPAVPETYDAMVVVAVSDLSAEALSRLHKQVGGDATVSIEYACLWSGVLVLKFSAVAVAERADVVAMARRRLEAAGIKGAVDYLHVHIEPRGTGKC
jgi:hypothetical protein